MMEFSPVVIDYFADRPRPASAERGNNPEMMVAAIASATAMMIVRRHRRRPQVSDR
jgi:hypothetical protein